MADAGTRRTDAELGFEVFQLMRCAEGEDFDAAIVQIASPAAHAKIARHTLREVAVPYALHLAGDIIPARESSTHLGDFTEF